MKNRSYIYIIVILVSLVLAAAWWMRSASASEPDAQASAPGAAMSGIPVRVLELTPQSFAREHRFNGTLEARESVVIRSELAGRVSAIHFEDGDTVKRGDILLELDDREWAAQLEAAREEQELARLNSARLELLFGNNVVTERERDEAVSRQRVLAATVEQLETRLERATIIAPFDGVLGFREVSPGALLESSSRITSLTTVDPLLVDFMVPEALRRSIVKGAEIVVKIAGESTPKTATIEIWESSIDPTTRTLRVRARMQNPDGTLLPGAFARVTLRSINDEAIVIPAEALIRGLADVAVFVVEDGKAQRRVVRVGNRDGENVEILEGLQSGERLIFRGMQRARSDGPVEIVEERKQSSEVR